MYENYTKQALPERHYRELLGTALYVFNTNCEFIIEIVRRLGIPEKYDWYKALYTDVTKNLSPIETSNAKFIKALESGGEASETKEKQTSCDEAFEVSIVDPSGPTNIRDKPSGATVMQIDGNAVIKVKNSERGW